MKTDNYTLSKGQRREKHPCSKHTNLAKPQRLNPYKHSV